MDSVLVKGKKKKITKEEAWGFGLASIPLIGFIIFGFIPLILAFAMSFMHMKGLRIDENTVFVGLQNFKTVLTDAQFYKSWLVTLYAALGLPIGLVLSLVISILLTQNIKCKKLFRTIFFIPYVCSMVAITQMWQWIFDYNYGILNSVLVQLGHDRIFWLGGDGKWFMPCMIFMGVWSGMGFNIILFSAALTNVNRAYYEAAEIDGANAWKRFVHITLPAISPTSFYLLVMGLIGALQDFTRFQVMAGDGGPNNAGLTVVFLLYKYIFGGSTAGGGSYRTDVGIASTMAILVSVIIVLITILNFRLSKKWVSYD